MDLNDLKCPTCGIRTSYAADFDSFYCEPCNEWLEDICNDRECLFCTTRPLKPNEQNIKES
jgi:hypothetical protein